MLKFIQFGEQQKFYYINFQRIIEQIWIFSVFFLLDVIWRKKFTGLVFPCKSFWLKQICRLKT